MIYAFQWALFVICAVGLFLGIVISMTARSRRERGLSLGLALLFTLILIVLIAQWH